MPRLAMFLFFFSMTAFGEPCVVNTPDGKPVPNQQANSSDCPTTTSPQVNSANSDVVYKWKDKNGSWHFSQTPPVGEDAENVTYNYKQNIMDSPAKASAAEKTQTDQPEPVTEEIAPKKKRKLIMANSNKNKQKNTSELVTNETDSGTDFYHGPIINKTVYIERYPEKQRDNCPDKDKKFEKPTTAILWGGSDLRATPHPAPAVQPPQIPPRIIQSAPTINAKGQGRRQDDLLLEGK